MFKNKVVVITGAGSGIGQALAVQFAERGAKLALSDISLKGLEATRGMLPQGVDVRLYTLDVSSREAVFAHADEVKRDFGTAHCVINNAGATIIGTVNHTTVDEFEWQIGINMWGVLYGTKAFLPMMLAQREGTIVNISSVFGLLGFPTQGAYNMSKFAVRGLTECLWAELDGTGVRAVSVHPGGIRTNIDKVARRAAAANSDEDLFGNNADKLLVTPPADCAAQIVRGLERGQKRILPGHRASTLFWISRLFPDSYHAIIKRLAAT